MGFFGRQIENSPPGKIVRKTSQAATGGAVMFIAFLALMIFRHGLGTGDGTGDETAAPSTSKNSVDSSMATTEAPPSSGTLLTPDKAVGGLTSDEKRALSSNVLTLLIDEHDYLMQISAEPQPVYRPVQLSRIIELAPQARGDANGIRVLIRRRENARAAAEEKLKLELSHYAVPASAVHMAEDFVP
jgi:hypothetical protein